MNLKALLTLPLCAFLLGLGCKRDEPRPLATPAMPSALSAQQMLDPNLPAGHPPMPSDPHAGAMPGMPSAPAGADTLAWELPKGWTEARAGGMRLATLKPPVTGKIDVSVIVLPGTAGGELSNVNRWRGQVGLQPIDEAGRMHTRKQVQSKVGIVSLYDLAGEGADKQHMIAGLLFVDGKSWFVKMVGDEAPVVAARADFVKLLESLHLPAGN